MGLIVLGFIIAIGIIAIIIVNVVNDSKYRSTKSEIQQVLGVDKWPFQSADDSVQLKSSGAIDKYDALKYFKEDRTRLEVAAGVMTDKHKFAVAAYEVLENNELNEKPMFNRVEQELRNHVLANCCTYNVNIFYRSPAGKSNRQGQLRITQDELNEFINNPSALMSKSEYNKLVKEQNKEMLDEKHHEYYERVNGIIDYANKNKQKLIIKNDSNELDRLIASLFDRTVNSIKKIKDTNSEEWDMLDDFISTIYEDVKNVVNRNKKILKYYESSDFEKIKSTCDTLMDSQRDFNNYIDEKAQSISKLFGTRVVRNETVVDDEFNYIRPYKKSLTPFTAEVSAQVFASAENNPIEYIVKLFYPDKSQYPEQIQKLQLLVEELETLKEAKSIIDNYKKDYQQYITDVPTYIMENDEDGFYSRLGFANVSENALTVEYKFSYTSGGGMAQRAFTIPMTEATIIELINTLQSKLTIKAFTKEQRSLMTSKLRQHIKERDNFTCKVCGNSTKDEPNLLLEIDHIIPVSKGGYTVEENLQTLCWKCNRSKGSKIM